MPLTLPPEEAREFAEGRAPAPHLDFLGAVAFRVAATALRLGVFDALADGPLTASRLADRIGTDPHATGLLLRALAGFEYVTTSSEAPGDPSYANSPAAGDRLLSGSPDGYAHVLSFWDSALELWGSLERSVRTGRAAVDFYGWLDQRPATLGEFHTMLTRLADLLAPEAVAAVPVPAGPSRLLDVGGGHARYSIAFCAAHPQLSATVLDLAGAVGVGVAAVAAAGMRDRVACAAWDIGGTDPVPGGPYDVALLFNVVHGFGEEQNLALLSRVAAATAPGGTIALVEPLDDDGAAGSRTGDAFVRVFSLNLFHGQGGRTYPFAQIAEWLRRSGFTDVRQQPFAASPSDHLVLATRAA